MSMIKWLMKSGTCIMLSTLSISCATIISGSKQNIQVQSRPSDAKVTVYNKQGKAIGGGLTPLTLNLNRGDGFFSPAKYFLKVEKDGYMSREIPIVASVNGWYILGNFVFGGLIGWLIVDPATGAMWTLNPGDVRVELRPQYGDVWNNSQGLIVVLREQVPEELVKFLTPIIPN